MRRAVGLVTILLMVAVGCGNNDTSADGNPTLTFDGTTATYDGPATLPAGSVTFTLVNQSDVRAGFLWGRHVDKSDLPARQGGFDFHGIEVPEDGVFTMEHVNAWPNYSPPPWVEETWDFPEQQPHTTIESATDLTVGRYELVGFDPAAQQAYPAAIIEVVEETGE
jgi:hypothetical protein